MATKFTKKKNACSKRAIALFLVVVKYAILLRSVPSICGFLSYLSCGDGSP